MHSKMIKTSLITTLIFLALADSASADKVMFKNGAVLKGNVVKQNTQTLSIDINGKVTTYSQDDIANVVLDVQVTPPPPPPAPPPALTTNTTVPLYLNAGSTLHVSMNSTISSSQHRQGYQFKMRLESDLLTQDGNLIASKGSDVYGTVVASQQAGRLRGESKMIITLTAITVGSKQVAIKTNSIDVLAHKSQGRDTVGKVARGAAIGGLINGSDGAKDGAKVGAGLAVLTRGRATGIPAGTILDFTTTANIKIK